MKYLIYLSSAVKLMTQPELVNLLKYARTNNQKHNVTGVLLYSDGTFIQVLEGMSEDVDTIFQSIEKDKRHKNITKLIDEPLDERNFPDWSMGFAAVDKDLDKELAGYLQSTAGITASNNSHSAISTLKTFIESNNLTVNN